MKNASPTRKWQSMTLLFSSPMGEASRHWIFSLASSQTRCCKHSCWVWFDSQTSCWWFRKWLLPSQRYTKWLQFRSESLGCMLCHRKITQDKTIEGSHQFSSCILQRQGRRVFYSWIGLLWAHYLHSVILWWRIWKHIVSKFSKTWVQMRWIPCWWWETFNFTGISGDVRQVPSKPDGIGLWFYECCARLKCGKAFLLSFQMHHDMNGAIKVSDVVKQWGA